MRALLLLLSTLLAASALSASEIQVLGKEKISANVVAQVRKAATAAKIEILGLEILSGDGSGWISIAIPFAYGPMVRAQNGLCRGTVYGIDSENGNDKTWRVKGLEPAGDQLGYVVDSNQCPADISSRVLIAGAVSDTDLRRIIDAIRERKVAYDPSGRPKDVHIGKDLSIDQIVIEDGGQHATAVMVNRAGEESLKVRLTNFGANWLIGGTE